MVKKSATGFEGRSDLGSYVWLQPVKPSDPRRISAPHAINIGVTHSRMWGNVMGM